MRPLLLPLFFFYFFNLNAQSVDSLIIANQSEINDTVKCVNYRSICTSLMYESFDSSAYYGKLGLKLAQEKKIIKEELAALLALAYIHYDRGHLLESHNFYDQLRKIATTQNDSLYLAHAANGSGIVNWKLGKMEVALKDFQEVHQLSKAINNPTLLKFALNNMGLINTNQNNYEAAMRYFSQLRETSLEKDDKNGLYLAYINQASVHIATKEYALAEEELYTCLEIVRSQNLPTEIVNTYYHFGMLYQAKKQYIEALKYAQLVIDHSKKYKIQDKLSHGYLLKTQIFNGTAHHQEAILTAKKGIKAAAVAGYIEPEFYGLLAESNEKIGNFEQAFMSHKLFKSLEDSLFVKEKEKEVTALEISFQSKEKEAENALLTKDKMLLDNQSKEKTSIIIMISIILFLFLVLASQLIISRDKDQKIQSVLEEQVQARTKELNLTNKQLVQSNKELKHFAYIASHDLKEPLRNISGFIALIKRKGDKLSKEEFNEYFDFIENSNLQMKDLVDNILKYAQLESNAEMSRETTDLRAILEEIKMLKNSTFKKKNIQLIYPDLPVIEYYPYVIKKVLKNIIENSIKYNKNEIITIEIYTKIFDQQTKVYIKDNGIGINPLYHEKIFEMFSRLNNRGDYNGSGMGLAYCKKILNQYQGEIVVSPETKEGNGTTIILTLNTPTTEANSVVENGSLLHKN